ncbi:MAG: hypothetical protein JRJ87_16580 [Deltaproteobacteria bacterium]|nr:hypothetical protein [Deltaproteobacteria bacterium]
MSNMATKDPCRKYFIYLCRKLFQLEKKFGYKASKPSRRNAEITWRLKKGDREILMMIECIETFSVPTILFRPPNRKDAFGLHEAVPAIDPEHDAKRPKGVSYSMNRKQIRALMEHWAEFFQAHAKELLVDQKKTIAAIKKFRKTKPDPYP